MEKVKRKPIALDGMIAILQEPDWKSDVLVRPESERDSKRVVYGKVVSVGHSISKDGTLGDPCAEIGQFVVTSGHVCIDFEIDSVKYQLTKQEHILAIVK